MTDSTETSTVRFNDFQGQWRLIGSDALEAVERVGRKGWFILGEEVTQFEAQPADVVGANYVVGCASGSTRSRSSGPRRFSLPHAAIPTRNSLWTV